MSLDFFFQAEDGIRDLVRSRGLGDVYKRQVLAFILSASVDFLMGSFSGQFARRRMQRTIEALGCLLYTSDAADERSSVDLGGRRIIKKKKTSIRMLHTLGDIEYIDEDNYRATNMCMN